MEQSSKKLFILSLIFFLASCGGGGGDGGGDGGGGGGGGTPQAPQALEGVFLDSAVMGLAYRTATRSGITDSQGTFEYLPGEVVTFSLGGIEFGSSNGQAEVTPVNLLGAENIEDLTDEQVSQLINMHDTYH